MNIIRSLAAVAACALAVLSTASAQLQMTSRAGITLGELGTAIEASGGRVLGVQEGIIIAQSSFGQQFLAALEFCQNPPRCGIVYLGSRVPNQSGQTISSVNRLNAGPGMARHIWLDAGRSDIDSRFLVDQGISVQNLTLNIAFYTVELDRFQKLMVSGIRASVEDRDPREVFDGGMTMQQVGVRDDAMASFLNQLPAGTAAGFVGQSATAPNDEAQASRIDALLDTFEHKQVWGAGANN